MRLDENTNYIVELDNGSWVVGFTNIGGALWWPDSRCNCCGSSEDSDESQYLVAVYELNQPATQAQTQSIQESVPAVKQLQPRTIKDSPEEAEEQRHYEEAIMLQEKCERLEQELQAFKSSLAYAVDCVDKCFQTGGQPEPPILPDFCEIGESKFEACVRLAQEYKRLEQELADRTGDWEYLKTLRDELQAELAELRKQPEWLPYPENKPTEDGLYFVTLDDGSVHVFSWPFGLNSWGTASDTHVRAFMPSEPKPQPYQPPKPKSVVEQATEIVTAFWGGGSGIVTKRLNEAGLLRKDGE